MTGSKRLDLWWFLPLVLLEFVLSQTFASDVLEYTDANFDKLINQHEWALISFCAPWSSHCKMLALECEKAATKLKDSDPPIPLIKCVPKLVVGLLEVEAMSFSNSTDQGPSQHMQFDIDGGSSPGNLDIVQALLTSQQHFPTTTTPRHQLNNNRPEKQISFRKRIRRSADNCLFEEMPNRVIDGPYKPEGKKSTGAELPNAFAIGMAVFLLLGGLVVGAVYYWIRKGRQQRRQGRSDDLSLKEVLINV